MINDFYKRAGVKYSTGRDSLLKDKTFFVQERYDNLLGDSAGWVERLFVWFRRNNNDFKDSLSSCVGVLGVSESKKSWYSNQVKILRDRSRNRESTRTFTAYDILLLCNNLDRYKNQSDKSYVHDVPAPSGFGSFKRKTS